MEFQRSSGLLLHPTSLPGPFGVGTLGREARGFVDFLILAQQRLWQVFPLGPTGYGDSPYQGLSAFAGNPLLLDLEKFKARGLLLEDELESPAIEEGRVDYGRVLEHKRPLLWKAFHRFREQARELDWAKLERFRKVHSHWLEDFALFMALKEFFGGCSWQDWPHELRHRHWDALAHHRHILAEAMDFQIFLQYEFFNQWLDLKAYANAHHIRVVGDMPIFVALDSADAWAHPELFHFDEHLRPIKVAGVPPDYFSPTGQLWGNPLYNWEGMSHTGFEWWIQRIQASFQLVDILRIDHFRGFVSCWAVPNGAPTAQAGSWDKAMGWELFQTLERNLGHLPLIAEDLGLITPEVEKLRDAFGFPGMKILQFAFESKEDNGFLPHNYSRNSVVYTGSHDNDTSRSWYDGASGNVQHYVRQYLNADTQEIAWALIRGAWASPSVWAFTPLQDLLQLGKEARMNVPGKASGNWQWRFRKEDLNPHLAARLRVLTQLYHR